MDVGVCVQCPFCLSGFNENLIEILNINFHEIPSSGSRVFNLDGRTDGRTDRHDQTIASSSNFERNPIY